MKPVKSRKIWLVLAVCILLFGTALTICMLFSEYSSQEALPPADAHVVLNELMASNRAYPDPNGVYADYIELYNPGDITVDLAGYKLSDREDEIGYTFPQGVTLAPGEYLVLWCGAGESRQEYVPFQISRSKEETVYLYNSANVLIDRQTMPVLPANTPWGRDGEGRWQECAHGTPGFENTEQGYQQWIRSVGIRPVDIVISEVQAANRSSLLNSRGQFRDWIELYNRGSQAAVLDGYYLSDDPAEPFGWKIPALTIPPGGYAVIFCAGDGAAAGEADFALSKNGCSLTLYGPVMNLTASLEVPPLKTDYSWQLQEDGVWRETDMVSPGYGNTPAGHEAFLDSRVIPGPLAVWEVMSSNDRFLMQSDGSYHDWAELKNISDTPIDLSDYYLSDNAGDLLFYRLPSKILQPGELVTVILAGDAALTGRGIYAPFGLDYRDSVLYVTHGETGISDYLHICGVPYQGSAGRMDGQSRVFYFSSPTPGKENADGMTAVASSPFVETPAGVYNDVSGVSVVLSGEGQIHYTLDGSLPTESSPVYTQPIVLTQTATVRAASFTPDKLPSLTVTANYIINENHTMPVISISADPDAMFGYSGIYTNYKQDREIPCNLSFFEEDSGFSIDCGIKMHGHTGLMNPKKSFKINFRGVYGANVLNYPVYGEDAPQIYDSLIIRAGQDYPFAIFREELFSSLCQDMSDHVLTQRSRFCIVYINGQYWGIYNLKEAFTELYYAQNRGVSEQSVQIEQAPVFPSADMFQVLRFMRTADMTKQENYDHVCSVVNIDSLIDWMIIQGYSTNGDIQQNLRYIRSTENGNRFEMALYDLDWAFYYHLAFTDILSNDRQMNWQHLSLTRNIIKNPDFRQKFLERLSYHMEHTLSNDYVLGRIDELYSLLEPEVAREKARWGGSKWSWEHVYVANLRAFITKHDHLGDIVRRLQRYIGLTQKEIDQYFWRWV